MENSYYLNTLTSFADNGGYLSKDCTKLMEMKKTILPRMRDLRKTNVDAQTAGCLLACEYSWLSSLHFATDLCNKVATRAIAA